MVEGVLEEEGEEKMQESVGVRVQRKGEEGSSLSRSASLPPATRERSRVKRRAPLPPGMQPPRRQQSEDRKESTTTLSRGQSRAELSLQKQKSVKKEFGGSLGRRES